MKSVKIKYFAILREQAKTESEQLSTDCPTYAELYLHLSEKYGFKLPPDMIQVAVNDEFARMKDELRDGTQIVFIPPVAGG
jgi:molybdopterin converting factor subunit 1